MPGYEKLDEEQLLLNLKRGDDAVFTEIYNRHWEEMLNIAYRRLGSREDAEEVVQEVFVSLFLRKQEISLRTSLTIYLRAALKYKVIDAYRSQQMHIRHISNILSETSTNYDAPDQKMSLKEMQRDVMEIVEKLPVKCREVFVKSRFEHLSHQLIAESMGISVSTVKKHICKATALIRKEMNKNEADLLFLLLIFLSTKR
ncbi:RNA polymerase sigma-70 factor [Mucilaginibacter sp. 21P]|uniref:RNA polymerase sigma factor n=1 Tax=Mucilaginibacter sp. 21P TaxID=2778902 RepID=UPI001C586861|nr:RNA polymerase sigma-70 factor [Mucilaginibacter sp. 21P]QXV64710.1 RNA polymerase sigma-70 factor [Mucilaginibacter sp. 21P]